MVKKDTTKLQKALSSSADLTAFLKENEKSFLSETVTDVLNRILLEKKIPKTTLAKEADMSEIYLHQIFAGRRNPSRSRLLCLCYGFHLSLDETQKLLKECGHAPLYAKNRRDAIIIYGLIHKNSIFEVNDQLFDENEETLC